MPVLSAPGDILFTDDFQDGTLATWTTTNAAFSGVDNLTSSTGEGGAGLSMFTFGTDVTVTSPVVNTNGLGGVQLSAWVRKGSDAFSEDPDNGEDLELEYFSSGGTWELLQVFSAATLADGQVVNLLINFPITALHGAFQIRFHQLGGNGERGALPGWDMWHIDDVVLTETSSSATPTPFELGACEDFESLSLGNWTFAGAGSAQINASATALDTNSLDIFSTTISATSIAIDTSSAFQGLRFDVQRGSDAFSENPEAGENLVVEYLDSGSNWVILQTYNGNGAQGQFFDDQTFLTVPPAIAQHANFQIRFRLLTGSGANFDHWHIDDVCILANDAVLSVNKSVAVEEDPINATSNPKAIIGAYSIYTITVNETAGGLALGNSLALTDTLPDGVSLFVGDFDGSGSPLDFIDGATSSGISYTFASLNNAFDDVEFLDAGGAVLGTITPDADGFASAVRQVRINTGGAFQANGSMSISFRVRID